MSGVYTVPTDTAITLLTGLLCSDIFESFLAHLLAIMVYVYLNSICWSKDGV